MMALPRRSVLAGAAAWLAGASVGRAQAPREIGLTARRYEFTPDEIALKAGERVVLAIRSIDFTHGFSVPDLALRADLLPGLVTRVELQPTRPGTIQFLCDNFCGDSHEEMNGRFIVSE